VPLSCGVLQGSVLEPLLFTLYITPPSSLIHSHKTFYHLYADDTQVYISLSTAETDLSLKQLGDCFSDISGWMTNNKLRLTANKTDFIIIGTSRRRNKHTHLFTTNMLSHSITPSDTVCNLGVTLDSDLNVSKHISPTCHSCFYHIRDLHRIRHYIYLSVAKNNCYRIQNCLAKVVTRSPRFSHSVPLLKYLHRLPVQSRIIFKLCTIAYQTLSSGEPSYLFSMPSLSPKPRELRSSGFHLFSVPRVETHAGIRAFSVAVSTLWNSLSEHVNS